MDFLTTHAKPLYKNGYKIIPISKGYKFPKGIKHWQDIEATPKMAQSWIKNESLTGVGILTSTTPAVDIDVQDELIVEQLINYMQEQNIIGEEYIARIGAEPKVLLPFRLQDGDEGFYKVQSSTYIDGFADTHKLEVLGIGQQFVAHHIHPDTGKPYYYVSKDLTEIKHQDLPSINAHQAKELVDRFEEIAFDNEDWQVKSKGKTKQPVLSEGDELSALDNVANKLGLSNDEMLRTLDKIDPDISYDDWKNVGMGLYYETEGEELGYRMFKQWSEKGDKNVTGDVTWSKWESFKPDFTKGAPITFATAKKLAKFSEYESEEGEDLTSKMGDYLDPKRGSAEAKIIDRYLDRYVYIQINKLVADRHDKNDHKFPTLEEFHLKNLNRKVKIIKPLVSNPLNEVARPVSQLWHNHSDRITVNDIQYSPGRKYIYKEGIKKYLNTFHFPDHMSNMYYREGDDQIKMFLRHLRYLIPDDTSRKWFKQWIAFTIQQPQTRCPIAPILVSPVEGTGRTWLTGVLSQLFGRHNSQEVTPEQLLGEKSMFNEYLSNTKFVFCEELYMKTSGDRRRINESLKSDISDPQKLIRHKYGAQGTELVYPNFYFNTNHYDALPLDENSRRFNVFQGPLKKKSQKYYEKLYRWIEHEEKSADRLAQLFYYFDHYSLEGFNIAAPLDTHARSRMIDLSKSDADHIYNVIAQKYPVLTVNDLFSELSDSHELVDTAVSMKQTKAILRERGAMIGRPSIDNQRHRLYTLDKTKHYSTDEARDLYTKYLKSKEFIPSKKETVN